ncbi:protease complex subunit PrcB family protein [Altibacter sp.]|uniref:protease complex subunit PrcB family protein n=1 Tax=Altibacter sp. TaxID=2024823 RepID=UPI000C8B9B3A|nr:protease complex subunit PrcB family protein [Altibacter sp.]MAP56036.1 hypothetical protein [Altibacter sp.]
MKLFMTKPFRKYSKVLIILCAVLLSFLWSCKSSTNNSKPSITASIDFTVLEKGSHGNFTNKQERIISDQITLQDIYNTINGTRKPGLPVPEVDFSKYQVAFITSGERSTGGYSIAIDTIVREEEQTILYIGGESPKPGDYVTTVITAPFILVKFEKQSVPVVFRYSLHK